MKNKIFSIILIALLALPICVWAVDDIALPAEETSVVNMLDEDTDEKEVQDESQFKQPISKRKIAKKFLAAMGGVVGSSFAIFFILSVYNRMRENYLNRVKTLDGEVTLETPDDVQGAIKSFLDKTNWKV